MYESVSLSSVSIGPAKWARMFRKSKIAPSCIRASDPINAGSCGNVELGSSMTGAEKV